MYASVTHLSELLCCLLQTAVGGGHGAGLESAEARRGAVPGCAAGLHCPHQLLLRLHSGSHSGALSCLCHTPRSKVNTCTDTLAFIALYHYTELKPCSALFLSPGFCQRSSWSSSAQLARSCFQSFSFKSCKTCLSASKMAGCCIYQSFHRGSWTTPCTDL